MKLVIYHTNWADEMDLEGFQIFSAEEWEKFQSDVRALDEQSFRFEVGFGTNESNEYKSSKEFLDEFTVTEISKEDAAKVVKLFELGPYGFGMWPGVPKVW